MTDAKNWPIQAEGHYGYGADIHCGHCGEILNTARYDGAYGTVMLAEIEAHIPICPAIREST